MPGSGKKKILFIDHGFGDADGPGKDMRNRSRDVL